MATEVEYVNYKDFVADLESTENPGVDDVTIVSNRSDGPRTIPTNTSALTNTATDSDLNAAASFELQTASGKKKAPANLLAKQSALETTNGNVVNLQSVVTGLQTKISEFYCNEFLIGACIFNLIDKEANDVELGKFILADGSTMNNSSYNTTGYVPVVGGLEYKVSYGWNDARCICWFNSQKAAIGYDERIGTVTVPANAAFARLTVSVAKWETQMFAPKDSLPSSFLAYGKFEFNEDFKLYDKFSEMGGLLEINQCKFTEYNLIDKEADDVELGKFILADGSTMNNSSYNTTGYMPVVGGLEYKVSYGWNDARCICWFNSQKAAIGYDERIGTVTVPANAAFARLTVSVAKWETQMFAPKDSLPSTYLEYGKLYIKKSVLPSGNISSPGFRVNDGALSVDSSLSISGLNVSKNTLINAHVKGSIDTISVGVGYLGFYGYWVEITPTQAVVKSGSSGAVQQTLEHGLTLDNELSVTIDRSMSLDGVEITMLRMVTQKGGVYEHELTWGVAPGVVFVRNQNSSGSIDCSLSFMIKDSSKCVWLFGDSYMGYKDPNRWPYYIVSQLHYTNFLLNALGGENSSGALSDFKTILGGVGNRPLFAVWLQGMNGGNDGEGVPNSTWLANTEEFIRTCEQEGIIPVLSTTPTVPDYSHVYMNEWVRSSGCRYIDLAAAVEKEGTNTWKFYGETEAYLSGDLVHPTSYGAKAMCERVLKDFPEISIGTSGLSVAGVATDSELQNANNYLALVIAGKVKKLEITRLANSSDISLLRTEFAEMMARMGEAVAAALNDLDARIRAVDEGVSATNLGERTADRLDVQTLLVGGEDVT